MNKKFLKACLKGDIELVKEFLKNNIDPSCEEGCAITLVSYGSYSDNEARTQVIIELLKDPRVDPSIEDNYAIKRAFEYQQKERLIELLKDPRVKIPKEVIINIDKYNIHDPFFFIFQSKKSLKKVIKEYFSKRFLLFFNEDIEYLIKQMMFVN